MWRRIAMAAALIGGAAAGVRRYRRMTDRRPAPTGES
jgi:hypothetical protein